MSYIPHYINLKGTNDFPFELIVPTVRFRGDRKFTSSMAVVTIEDVDDGEYKNYLGEGFTSRSPLDKNNEAIGNGIAYSRALIDALQQHINYLKEKENK